MTRSRGIWVLADERQGNRSQVIGVAKALKQPFLIKEIRYNWLACIPNILLGASFASATRETRLILPPPWPRLVISAGRRTGPIARAIKRKSGGSVRLIQIMNPGSGAEEFDLIALPTHDLPTHGKNTMSIVGAPNELNEQELLCAYDYWHDKLCNLTKPRIALVVGGSTRRRVFSDRMARELGEQVANMARSLGGTVMLTTSRRTGGAATELINALDCPKRVFLWGDYKENPYKGFLALADMIIVTGDSVSLCSEACSTPAPVYIYAPEGLISPKHKRFLDQLIQNGHARIFCGQFDSAFCLRLNTAAKIASEIERRFF
ncbi:MAG: hypothetical protein CBB68_11490 [Rhodospirillaceae bacterium TMED8]|nr:nucleoside-diphosphate sugar epimerase [Magnetovibrio sp.]OUT49619.1 MAG: hypothetical protein CBB68_11490 [Rhodospirillaceae bacterium TMED8]